MDTATRVLPLASLERRLAAVVRTNRLLWLVCWGLGGAALIAGANPSSDTPGVLRARSIQLVDETGRVRAELAIDAEGSAGLFVRDSQNRLRATLTHDDGQSALFLWDEHRQVRVGVAQFAHGGGGVALHGAGGAGSTALYHHGAGSLTFYDASGKATARVPAVD